MTSSLGPSLTTYGFQAIFIGPSQKVTTSGTSQQFTLSATTTIVRITGTQDVFVLTGANPTVTSSNGMWLKAGFAEYINISPGQKLAVIQDSAAGVFYLTEGA